MRPDEPCVHERAATGPLARFFYNTGLPCVECEREAHEAWLEGVRAEIPPPEGPRYYVKVTARQQGGNTDG